MPIPLATPLPVATPANQFDLAAQATVTLQETGARGAAIASFVLGVASICMACLPLPGLIFATFGFALSTVATSRKGRGQVLGMVALLLNLFAAVFMCIVWLMESGRRH